MANINRVTEAEYNIENTGQYHKSYGKQNTSTKGFGKLNAEYYICYRIHNRNQSEQEYPAASPAYFVQLIGIDYRYQWCPAGLSRLFEQLPHTEYYKQAHNKSRRKIWGYNRTCRQSRNGSSARIRKKIEKLYRAEGNVE